MENKLEKFHVFTPVHYPHIVLNNSKLGDFVGIQWDIKTAVTN